MAQNCQSSAIVKVTTSKELHHLPSLLKEHWLLLHGHVGITDWDYVFVWRCVSMEAALIFVDHLVEHEHQLLWVWRRMSRWRDRSANIHHWLWWWMFRRHRRQRWRRLLGRPSVSDDHIAWGSGSATTTTTDVAEECAEEEECILIT